MTKEFIWFPDASHTVEHEPRVYEAQFGDGYSQSAPAGLNTDMQTWQLTFTGNDDDVNPIYAFLREHKGAISFYWKTPYEEMIRVRCKTFSRQREHAVKNTLTATFNQIPDA